MNWLDTEVAFYDFIWAHGTSACTKCINRELFEDFAAGGQRFDMMKAKVMEKWPTSSEAWAAFRKHQEENE